MTSTQTPTQQDVEYETLLGPSILVVLGVTGDLAEKKIIPALWHLFQHDRLPEQLSIVGVARRDLSSQAFHDFIRGVLAKRSTGTIASQSLAKFVQLFSYVQGDFAEVLTFRELLKELERTETEWGVCANKLFYLAVPPTAYEVIFQGLAAVKLNLPCGGELGWSRILIEKPFGTDLASATQLQSLLTQYFQEEQIYRIDHYLFKEIVQGIENFRFSNNLFENVWDNSSIDRIDLRLLETIGAQDRGQFYDGVGALRDVGQNHLLSMLAVLTMDYPATGSPDAFRAARAQILETLVPWTDEAIKQQTYRSQYDGYGTIDGVQTGSTTETYFALQTELAHPKWQGVPIFIEAGKRLAEARKEIVVTLKHPRICHLCPIGKHAQNQIIFRLEPQDEITITFQTKKPGFERTLEERSFSFFLYEKQTKTQYVEEYAKVLVAAMAGDQLLFTSTDEVNEMWRFADPVVNAWRANQVPLEHYAPDTTPHTDLHTGAVASASRAQPNQTIGIVGLGKMGANLARQLLSKGWQVVGFNRSSEATKALEREGLLGAPTVAELVNQLPHPRTIWLMVPHQAVDRVLDELLPLLAQGDTVIDGGNSPYQQSIERHRRAEQAGIQFLDVGVSGGPAGALSGACLMIGGEQSVYDRHETLFRTLAVPDGYGRVGGPGAGHFVKMVHNGIEYGMMQAVAEGFDVMKVAPFGLDLTQVADIYNHGSVIESRLIGWLKRGYEQYGPELESISATVAHTGEGAWTVEAAKKLGVDVPIIEGSLEVRKQSVTAPRYAGKVLSVLRNMFGGHSVTASDHKQGEL